MFQNTLSDLEIRDVIWKKVALINYNYLLSQSQYFHFRIRLQKNTYQSGKFKVGAVLLWRRYATTQ